jgi:hypothetical protein
MMAGKPFPTGCPPDLYYDLLCLSSDDDNDSICHECYHHYEDCECDYTEQKCYYEDCECDYTEQKCSSCDKALKTNMHSMCYSCNRSRIWETYKILKERVGGQYHIAFKIWILIGFRKKDLMRIRSSKPCYTFLQKRECHNPLCLYRHIHRSSDPCPDFLEGHCPCLS